MIKNILLIILSVMLLVGCSDEYSAVYQSVSAESKWDESQRIIITGSNNELPIFKVNDNILYLMIQGTRSDGYFRTVTHYPSWNKADMKRFIEDHDDIKSLIPNDWNDWLPKGFGDECKGKITATFSAE